MNVGDRVLDADGVLQFGPRLAGRGTVIRSRYGLLQVLWDGSDERTWCEESDLQPIS